MGKRKPGEIRRETQVLFARQKAHSLGDWGGIKYGEFFRKLKDLFNLVLEQKLKPTKFNC